MLTDTKSGSKGRFYLCQFLEKGANMATSRRSVSKSKSAKSFNRNTSKTKAANVKSSPMRGGIRA